MKKNWYTCLFLCSISMGLFAQTRYLEPVFEEINVTSDVTYGSNISILPIILQESDMPQLVDLKMDIYEPAGDEESLRPVVIMASAGGFLTSIR